MALSLHDLSAAAVSCNSGSRLESTLQKNTISTGTISGKDQEGSMWESSKPSMSAFSVTDAMVLFVADVHPMDIAVHSKQARAFSGQGKIWCRVSGVSSGSKTHCRFLCVSGMKDPKHICDGKSCISWVARDFKLSSKCSWFLLGTFFC